MSVKQIACIIALGVLIGLQACKPDPMIGIAAPAATANTTPYTIVKSAHFPAVDIPADNPMTVEGVQLGRMLFYDPILSGDSTLSCGGCHRQENAFAEPNQFSEGITKVKGTRNAMPLFNLAFLKAGFFWDGRSTTLEKQILEPVPNPIEMHQDWPRAVSKLQRTANYPDLYKKAFGTDKISSDNTAKAIAQFLRSIVSDKAKIDSFLDNPNNQSLLTPSEFRGFQLFVNDPIFDKFTGVRTFAGADCFHCHGAPLFQDIAVNTSFRNNGLDSVTDISGFRDAGRGRVTGNAADYGKFKVPTLRNVALTAPYMHDGRFKTLEEVIDHYNGGGHPSPTLDKTMPSIKHQAAGGRLQLTEQDKKDLIAFLKTLTDYSLITNKAYSNPF